jgi:hemolysin activation/secretion protein
MNACRPTHLLLATVASILSSAPVLAIDAGSQLRRFQDETQQRAQTRRPGGDPIPQWPASPSQAAASSSVQTHVSGFEVHGVTRFSEAEVATVLKEYIGRNLSTADIHAAANRLMRHYRNAGYMLTKVFVPPQTFAKVVRLDVEEGYLEPNGIEVINKGSRVRTEAVQSLLEAQLYSDSPLRREDVERALLLADDLPGTSVGSVIYPGQEVGTARLRTVMSDEPLLSGNIDVDNFNSRQLGQERLGTTLYLNSPTGVGDQLVTRLVTSGSRSNYAYLTYLRPIS